MPKNSAVEICLTSLRTVRLRFRSLTLMPKVSVKKCHNIISSIPKCFVFSQAVRSVLFRDFKEWLASERNAAFFRGAFREVWRTRTVLGCFFPTVPGKPLSGTWSSPTLPPYGPPYHQPHQRIGASRMCHLDRMVPPWNCDFGGSATPKHLTICTIPEL